MWQAIQEEFCIWARGCQLCQRSKVSRPTVTTFCDFPLPPSRFLQIRIDLVGPLPSSAGFLYCLTALDRFTRCSATFPHPDTAATVTRALLSGWIYHFGCPQTITTDQGRQFGSQVFHCLAKLCGIHLYRTSHHHPAANLVERLHRTFKAAIMCHADEQWTEALPPVLHGIRTAYSEDMKLCAAELVYGEPLRVPDELLDPSAPTVEPSAFIQQLRRRMDQLRPTPTARHSYHATFINRNLKDSIHVFLRQDAIRRALDPPYSVPHIQNIQDFRGGRQVTVSSLHRFWTGPGTTSLATPAAHQPNSTALQLQQSHHQFGPHAPIPVFVSTPFLFSAGVMWELPTCSETALSTRQQPPTAGPSFYHSYKLCLLTNRRVFVILSVILELKYNICHNYSFSIDLLDLFPPLFLRKKRSINNAKV